MLLHQILDIDSDEIIFLSEESYTGLKNPHRSLDFLKQIAQSGKTDSEIRAISDENGHIMCLAISNPASQDFPSFLGVFTDQVARSGISTPAAGQYEKLVSRILDNCSTVTTIEASSQELDTALREYLSYALVERQLCDICDKPSETYDMVYMDNRIKRLDDLLIKIEDKFHVSGNVLEICCGNGMATLSLEKSGIFPLTIDNDRCQVCQGLEHNVLKPERTIIMDVMRLSHFFNENSFDAVIGFMLGTIYEFDKEIWTLMMSESLKVVKPGGILLFTLSKYEEMDILKRILDGLGAVGEIIDNTDASGIYDQWVYLGQK